MPGIVRPAGLADAEAIARVKVRAWQAGYRGILDPDYLANMDICAFTKSTQRWMADPETAGEDWVVVVDGGVVGWAHARLLGRGEDPDSSAAELVALYVLPSHWGEGLGFVLNSHVSADLLQKGAESLSLWVLEENARAIGFYKRQGFVLSGARKPIELIAGTALWEVQYKKAL